jgi:hypothetical protein
VKLLWTFYYLCGPMSTTAPRWVLDMGIHDVYGTVLLIRISLSSRVTILPFIVLAVRSTYQLLRN